MFDALRAYPEAEKIMTQAREAGILPADIDNKELWFRNDIAQPLICLYQMMVWGVVKPLIPAPDIIAGYSLGEISAYGVSGAVSPLEAIRLATLRGKLMSDAVDVPQTMVAVIGLHKDDISRICERFGAYIAIVNAGNHFIIGLHEDHAEPFMQAAQEAGAGTVVHLELSVASHTPFMDAAATAFGQELAKTELNVSGGNILAGISGEKVFTREQAVTALTTQIHRTIDWRACLETAFSYGNRIFLELGPGHGLSRMALEAFHGVEARSLSEFQDLHAVEKWVKAVSARL